MTPDPDAACWDAVAWDAPEAVAAPTGSRRINRLLRGAWLSPPFTYTTRDRLVAQGLVVPAPGPVVADPYDTWSTHK